MASLHMSRGSGRAFHIEPPKSRFASQIAMRSHDEFRPQHVKYFHDVLPVTCSCTGIQLEALSQPRFVRDVRDDETIAQHGARMIPDIHLIAATRCRVSH